MNQDPFSEFLRKKAEEYQPAPRTSFSALEAKRTQKRKRTLIYWWSAALLLLSGSAVIWMSMPDAPIAETQPPAFVATTAAADSTEAQHQHFSNGMSAIASNEVDDTTTSTSPRNPQPALASDSKEESNAPITASTSLRNLQPALASDSKEESNASTAASTSPRNLQPAFATASKEGSNAPTEASTSPRNLQPALATASKEGSNAPTAASTATRNPPVVLGNDTTANEGSTPSNRQNSQEGWASETSPSFIGRANAEVDSSFKQEPSATSKVHSGLKNKLIEPLITEEVPTKKAKNWSIELGHSLFLAWNARNLNQSPELFEPLANRIAGIAQVDEARSGQMFHLKGSRKIFRGFSFATGISYSTLNFFRITQAEIIAIGTSVSLLGPKPIMHLDMQLQQLEWPFLIQWSQQWGKWGFGCSVGAAFNYTFSTEQYYYQLSTTSGLLRTVAPDETLNTSVWYGWVRAQAQWQFLPQWRLHLGPGWRYAFNRQYTPNEAYRFLTLESGLSFQF